MQKGPAVVGGAFRSSLVAPPRPPPHGRRRRWAQDLGTVVVTEKLPVRLRERIPQRRPAPYPLLDFGKPGRQRTGYTVVPHRAVRRCFIWLHWSWLVHAHQSFFRNISIPRHPAQAGIPAGHRSSTRPATDEQGGYVRAGGRSHKPRPLPTSTRQRARAAGGDGRVFLRDSRVTAYAGVLIGAAWMHGQPTSRTALLHSILLR